MANRKANCSTLTASRNHSTANRKPIFFIVQSFNLRHLDYVWNPYAYLLSLRYETFGKQICELSLRLQSVHSNVCKAKPS